MTKERFIALVNELEKEASRRPNLYRLKVLGLTGLGYGYVLVFLGIFIFLFGVSISMFLEDGFTFGGLKLLVLTLSLSFFILKALLFRMEMPAGYYVQKQEAIELFRILEDLRVKMKTPKIHAVVLTSELNAAVTQIPKFGLFGPKQNVLILGLPLLLTLTPAQLKAVLAHELAHISHADTAFGAKIYRVRYTWERLLYSLEKNEQFGTFLFRWFFKWYCPRYDAYTFVLARQQEYEADRAAAQVTSYKDKAEALCVLAMTGPYYYRDFYDELFEQSVIDGSVPHPYSDFARKIREINKERYLSYLNEELAEESSVTDTHPSLKDRLASLHVEPQLVEIGKEQALHFYFNNAEQILEHFDQMWKEYNEEEWQEQVAQYRDERKRLEELAATEVDDLNALLEKAVLTEKFKSTTEAIPMYEKIIHSFPANEDTALAYLALGKILVEDKKEEGLKLLERAAELSWECREPALETICWYYDMSDDEKNFERARERYVRWLETLEEVEQEMERISVDDHFVSHDQSQEEIAACLEQIEKHEEIMEAYLVKKTIKAMPERPYYILALVVENYAEEIEEQLYEKYARTFEGAITNTTIVILNNERRILSAIAKAAGKPLYRKEKGESLSIS
ncbi:M48 family metallopeptidase [Anoxybacteroides tepidamans]|uniref:M48 family metallopeptidase n=1 Tax=Anoxybacteroides tepidamans TaxID=265948 RepID=UPI00047F5D7E|nr:M48 family metallopeptidase [Anoxybacillus tepidamans]